MKDFVERHYGTIFTLFLLGIMGLSFGIGVEWGNRGSVATSSSGVTFSCPDTILEKLKIPTATLGAQAQSAISGGEEAVTPSSSPKSGAYMGSKNGTKYYTPGCPGSKRIKAENVIWFQSAEDATLQGYSKGSC